MSKFLVTNPSKRLGNMKGALGDVMKHKWFGSFDWHGLSSGTLLAPFVPDLTEFDTALATAKARHPSEVDGEEYEVSFDSPYSLFGARSLDGDLSALW